MRVTLQCEQGRGLWYRRLDMPCLPPVGAIITLRSIFWQDLTMWSIRSVEFDEGKGYQLNVEQSCDWELQESKDAEPITDERHILQLLGFELHPNMLKREVYGPEFTDLYFERMKEIKERKRWGTDPPWQP